MIRNVIKSDGSIVKFDPQKLNLKSQWAADRKVDWSKISLNVYKRLNDNCKTSDINKAIIDVCVEEFDEKHFLLAGRVLAGVIYKEAFGGFNKIPTIKKHHDKMVKLGYWENLGYTDEEFDDLEKVIDHTKDLRSSYSEIKQIADKYILKDRVNEKSLESPQFMYMGMAMANMKNMPKERRIGDIKKLYTYLSDKKICAPTPFMTNLRTPKRDFASCSVYTTHDTAKSLAAGDHISYMMTCASAGIGAHIKTRSCGDGVRGNTIVHQGKRPYFKMLESSVSANLQNSRGGSATVHVNVLDPEIEDIITWKSKKTASFIRVDGIHYSIGYNRLFAKKVKENEDWILVSYSENPELYEAMYEGNQEKFDSLYIEQELKNKNKKVNARQLIAKILIQSQESGQVYLHRTDEMNKHTPFKEKIYSSNLCQEIALPTSGYDCVSDLYKEDSENGEIGLCSLSAIVARRVNFDEWEDVAYYSALMIDNVIEIMDYPFPNLKKSAKARRSLGIGITDLAGHLAEKNIPYSTEEGKRYIFKIAENHMYSCIRASLRLAKERGVCDYIDRTKWPDGWLPIDTMNQNIKNKFGDLITKDWEKLREEIIEQGGIRNSVLVAYMPNESSSIATNGTNSILPARNTKLIKSNATKMTRFLVPNFDTLAKQYELAWDIETKDLIDVYSIFQAFTDQAISSDFYIDFTKSKASAKDMIKDFIYMTSMGMKTRYYVNSKTNSGNQEIKTEKNEKNIDISINKDNEKIELIEDKGCNSGGCTL